MLHSGARRTVSAAAKAAAASAAAQTFATWNPADKGSNVTLSNGNLTAVISPPTNGTQTVASTNGKTSGKWYWENHWDSTSGGTAPLFGVANSAVASINYLGSDTHSWGYFGGTGNKFTNNASSSYGSSYAVGDTVGVALDMDNGKVWFSKNGTWQESGDPAAGTNPAFTGLSGTMTAGIGGDSASAGGYTITTNFGATAFAFTPPVGFNAGLYS